MLKNIKQRAERRLGRSGGGEQGRGLGEQPRDAKGRRPPCIPAGRCGWRHGSGPGASCGPAASLSVCRAHGVRGGSRTATVAGDPEAARGAGPAGPGRLGSGCNRRSENRNQEGAAVNALRPHGGSRRRHRRLASGGVDPVAPSLSCSRPHTCPRTSGSFRHDADRGRDYVSRHPPPTHPTKSL